MAQNTETVQVMVRCRPINGKEEGDKRSSIITMDTTKGQVFVKNPKSDNPDDSKQFTFDQVFDHLSEQPHVFGLVAKPIIDSVMSGYNGTIFAYGQTGTGKTHTMEGKPGKDTQGIIPSSFDYIFSAINDTAESRYLVRASFLEIYNEEIRDLLAADAKEHQPGRGLELKETPDKGVWVKDLGMVIVDSVPVIKKLLEKGNKCRSVGATEMNQDSSRSHSIFTITIECSSQATADHVRVGKLNLVDLAGSERQSKTGSTGDRLKEATKINLSLSALGNVISALVDGHIPYRDSKLTRLLQDSLGGNTKTVMIANVGPADWNYDETMSTLRYANRAKNIKNKPKINEDPKDAMLREFMDEVERLKLALAMADDGIGGGEGRVGGAVHERVVYKQKDFTEADMESLRQDISAKLMKSASHSGSTLSDEVLANIQAEAARQAAEHKAGIAEEAKQAAAEAARINEEAQRAAGTLEEQQAAAVQAKAEKAKLLKKLRQYESKILKSEKDGGLVEIAKQKEESLRLKREELDRRRAEEEKRAKEIAQAEEKQLVKEKEYSSLQEEVSEKTKKLKKLYKKFQEVHQEVEEMYGEWNNEKDDLMENVRILHQQMRLKDLVIDLFVPTEETHKVMRRAAWDEDRELWVLERSQAQTKELHAAKRPVSASGLRRPTTDFTKVANAMGDLNPRFRSENILLLELDMPERTTFDYSSAASAEQGNVQEALNAAFADGDVLFVGNESFQNVYGDAASMPVTDGAQQNPQRSSSGRTRPSSARRKAAV